ncbi:MAG: amidohydrolase family protein [Pseudomonadota bacterium]
MFVSKWISQLGISLAIAVVTVHESGASTLYLIDAHSQVESEQTLQKVIPLMDKAGVKATILSARGGMNSAKIVKHAERHRGRIIPAIRTKSGAYKNNKQKYYRLLDKQVASHQYHAIAELLLFHARKGQKADEVSVYPDDDRVKAALKHAIRQGWPLVVHIEFAALAQEEKIQYMAGLREMLDTYPRHPFVLIHMGQLGIEDVRSLLVSRSNVYFMTSHSNPLTIKKSRQPWVNLFAGDVLAIDWSELMIEYSDRFILAFDNVWPEHWGEFYLQQAEHWRKALALLPEQVAHLIAHGNAERLWALPQD